MVARCSFRTPCETSWPAPALPSPTAALSSSRASRASGDSSQSCRGTTDCAVPQPHRLAFKKGCEVIEEAAVAASSKFVVARLVRDRPVVPPDRHHACSSEQHDAEDGGSSDSRVGPIESAGCDDGDVPVQADRRLTTVAVRLAGEQVQRPGITHLCVLRTSVQVLLPRVEGSAHRRRGLLNRAIEARNLFPDQRCRLLHDYGAAGMVRGHAHRGLDGDRNADYRSRQKCLEGSLVHLSLPSLSADVRHATTVVAGHPERNWRNPYVLSCDPSVLKCRASPARERIPSFAYVRERFASTVFTDTKSVAATSLFDLPSATSSAICRSVAVRPPFEGGRPPIRSISDRARAAKATAPRLSKTAAASSSARRASALLFARRRVAPNASKVRARSKGSGTASCSASARPKASRASSILRSAAASSPRQRPDAARPLWRPNRRAFASYQSNSSAASSTRASSMSPSTWSTT